MKFVLLALPNVYEALVTQLESEGHVVKLITWAAAYVGHDWARRDVEVEIATFAPDYVINNMPALVLLDTSNFTYIANTVASAELETNKWPTRQKAGELGFLLPTVLEECDINQISTSHTDTVFVKPKRGSETAFPNQTWKVPKGMCYKHNINFPSGMPVYVEQDLQQDYEGYCFFTMCNGEYTINQITGYTGTGNDKRIDSGGEEWGTNANFIDLTPTQYSNALSLCTTWLNYAATLGGRYQGELSFGVLGNDIYWYEQNSKRGTHGVFSGSGQDWLNSLLTDSSESTKTQWNYNF